MNVLWGPDKNLDYWAASRLGVVDAPERRAMALLASVSDERRFSFYCLSGQFPALGSVTKRIYLVRRWMTVLELEDGRTRASWCINATDRSDVPPTDHVVVMKNLIEGSELEYREIGNETQYGSYREQEKRAFPSPYHGEIGPYIDQPIEYHDWGWKEGAMDESKLLSKRAFDHAEHLRGKALYWRYKLSRMALEKQAERWVRLPEKPKTVEIEEGTLLRLLANQRPVFADSSATSGFTSNIVFTSTAITSTVQVGPV